MAKPSSASWQSSSGERGGTPSRHLIAAGPSSSSTPTDSMAITHYQPPFPMDSSSNGVDNFDFDPSPSEQQYMSFPQIDLAAKLVAEMQQQQQQQAQQQQHQQSAPQPAYQQHQQSNDRKNAAMANTGFLAKLRKMLDNPVNKELIKWADDGVSFFVTNPDRFGKEVLPNYFKHNQFSSFVRQLNMYGFHKVPNLEQGTQASAIGGKAEVCEYRNDHFQRDHPELIHALQRKPKTGGANKNEDAAHAGALTTSHASGSRGGASVQDVQEEDIEALMKSNNVWRAVQTIQRAQQDINADLGLLKASTSDLWREAIRSRERSKRQQDTMNKVLRFLAGVFGAQDFGGTHEREPARESSEASEQDDSRNTAMSSMGKGRLLIEDSSANRSSRTHVDNERIEELHNPSRFSEAPSAEGSPRSRTPDPSSKSRFTAIRSPEVNSRGIDEISSPRFAQSATPTPGGSRRFSQQQSNQIISALTSEEGSAWLASLFGSNGNGAQDKSGPVKVESPSPVGTPGGGFKVDPQTMAALQTVLNSSGTSGGDKDYFASSTPAQASLDAASSANGLSASSSVGSRNNIVSYGPGDGGGRNSAASASSPSPSDQQALALSLSRASQGLQHTGDNAAAVQESIASLIESLRLDPASLNTLLQQQSGNANGGGSLRSRTPSRSASGRIDASHTGAGADPSGGDAVDTDSFLDQFLNIGTPGSSAEAGPSNSGIARSNEGGDHSGLTGGTPFTLSPESASRFLDTLGDDDSETQRMRIEDAEEGDTRATADLHARAQATADRSRNRAAASHSNVRAPSGLNSRDDSPVTSLSTVGDEEEEQGATNEDAKGRAASKEASLGAGAKRKRHEDSQNAPAIDGASSTRKRKPTAVEVEEVGPARSTRRGLGGMAR